MKILWVSANKLGYELLKEAIKLKGIKIIGIVTLAADSKTVMYDGIKDEKWKEFAVKVFRVRRLNSQKKLIKKLSADLIVVCGWRQVIDKDILRIPVKGVIGFHPTLLPYGRGPAPVINTLLKGDTESGLTMFYMTQNLDDGDIIAQKKFYIRETDHAEDLYNKIVKAGKGLIREYLPLINRGSAPRMPQDASRAIVFKKLGSASNKIDFVKETPLEIYRKIKALSKPYRGAYLEKGNRRLIIWRAELKDIKK